MKNLIVKEISILGMVLIGASGIAAVLVPSGKNATIGHIDAAQTDENGVMDQTCLPGIGSIDCDYTAESDTTDGDGEGTSVFDNGSLSGMNTTFLN